MFAHPYLIHLAFSLCGFLFTNSSVSQRISAFRIPLFSLGAFVFLFLGFSSYIVNLDQSKVGHLIAYTVFFFYSIPLFKSLFSRHVNLKDVLSIIRVCSFVSFATLEFSIFFDYILLTIGIDYADLIPSMTNVPVMSFLASRPRGFFPEPTDASMALNVFYFLFLASNSAIKKFFHLY